MLQAGKLTVRGTIQCKTITQDTELNPIETWIDLVTNVWAQPLDKSSREFYRAATVNSEITAAYRIRYRRGITAHMRFIISGRTLDIIGDPENEGMRNESLLLICKGVT